MVLSLNVTIDLLNNLGKDISAAYYFCFTTKTIIRLCFNPRIIIASFELVASGAKFEMIDKLLRFGGIGMLARSLKAFILNRFDNKCIEDLRNDIGKFYGIDPSTDENIFPLILIISKFASTWPDSYKIDRFCIMVQNEMKILNIQGIGFWISSQYGLPNGEFSNLAAS